MPSVTLDFLLQLETNLEKAIEGIKATEKRNGILSNRNKQLNRDNTVLKRGLEDAMAEARRFRAERDRLMSEKNNEPARD